MKKWILGIFLFKLIETAVAQELPLEKIKLPPGFSLDLFVPDLPGARSLALGEKGTLFVGTRSDKVYALKDINGDLKPDKTYVIARGLNQPNGVAFLKGSLYVAEINRILLFKDIENRLSAPPQPEEIATYPSDRSHGWKFIRFGPDGRLYVPVGAPCNICQKKNPLYASLTSIKPDGSGRQIFASGVRNTLGFDWDPLTGELWFTDNGRDHLGDNFPPDELNHAPEAGLHFGYPFFHGTNIPDPQYGKGQKGSLYTPPAIELGAHVAALGMRFYQGQMFPKEYINQIFIAEHGSWNRSVPTGYRVTLVRVEKNQARSYEVFAEGWLEEGKAWGRPVDLLILPDGSLLLSDDKAGVIYRIRYHVSERLLPEK